MAAGVEAATECGDSVGERAAWWQRTVLQCGKQQSSGGVHIDAVGPLLRIWLSGDVEGMLAVEAGGAREAQGVKAVDNIKQSMHCAAAVQHKQQQRLCSSASGL